MFKLLAFTLLTILAAHWQEPIMFAASFLGVLIVSFKIIKEE